MASSFRLTQPLSPWDRYSLTLRIVLISFTIVSRGSIHERFHGAILQSFFLTGSDPSDILHFIFKNTETETILLLYSLQNVIFTRLASFSKID
jgi:hypothetical protein